MHHSNNDDPTSPMKKLKILSEKQQNVQQLTTDIQTLKENLEPVRETAPAEPSVEPLLQESSGQYVIFPINHEDMWHMYKSLVDNFWSVTETLQEMDKLSLNIDETQFMKYFSSIFASPHSQGLVNENFAEELCKLIQVTEAKFFYGHQLFVQNIHYELYNKLLDKFVTTKEEKDKMFKIVEEYESVAAKREWIGRWQNRSLADQLVASACLHGLLFSSIELVNDWLKNRARASFTHELIEIFDKMVIDQNLQRDFSCLLISHLRHKPSREFILNTINQAAKIEFDFLINGVKCDLIGLSMDDVLQLIDRKTKDLKQKMFNLYDDKKKGTSESDSKAFNKTNAVTKENNHQKITFDEDF